jgi:pimeloyl-ACP methyl ester carboxylesterase
MISIFGKETCSVDKIMIVAHSMGGYVARLTPIRHPHVQRYLPNIVTLATPHDNPLYAFDESIHRVHQSLFKEQYDSMLVVSSSSVGQRIISSSAHHSTFWNSHHCLSNNHDK